MKKLIALLLMFTLAISVNAQKKDTASKKADTTAKVVDTTKADLYYLSGEFSYYQDLEEALMASEAPAKKVLPLLDWIRYQITYQVEQRKQATAPKEPPKK